MNEQAVHKEQELRDGHILQIFQDTWAESPRTWSNLGTMAIFHKRYNFGDEVDLSDDKFPSWADMEEHLKNKTAVLLPIYLHDQSGITINTKGFADPGDPGQVGFIYTTQEKIKEKYSTDEITQEILEKATKALQEEVKVLDSYLAGEIYGFHLIKRASGKEDQLINSYSGFYGKDVMKNGMLDHVPVGLIPEELIPKL